VKAMSYRSVDAGRGIQWLTESVQLVMRNPAVFLVQALILSVLMFVLNFIPLIGQIAWVVLSPVLLAGMVYSMREVDRGGNADVGQLFAGFQQPGKVVPLMTLSIPQIVGLVVLVVLGFLFIGGSIIGAVASGGNEAAGAMAIGGGLLVFMLLAFVVSLAIAAVVIYAIPRVMFDDAEPFGAMKESFSASLANIAPLLIFAIIFFIVATIVFVVLSIIPILGSIAAMLAIYAVGAAAVYASYKDVFEPVAAAPADVIIPPPPGPSAPPPPPPPAI